MDANEYSNEIDQELNDRADNNGDRLVLAGETVDGRARIARRFRAVVRDILAQLQGRNVKPSERLIVTSVATLAVLIERDTAAILRGEKGADESLRRNIAAMRSQLVALGLAKNSRDVTKKDSPDDDPFAAALLDADD